MITSTQWSMCKEVFRAGLQVRYKVYFYMNVFISYYEEWFNEMDGIVKNRNDLQEKINTVVVLFGHKLIHGINLVLKKKRSETNVWVSYSSMKLQIFTKVNSFKRNKTFFRTPPNMIYSRLPLVSSRLQAMNSIIYDHNSN